MPASNQAAGGSKTGGKGGTGRKQTAAAAAKKKAGTTKKLSAADEDAAQEAQAALDEEVPMLEGAGLDGDSDAGAAELLADANKPARLAMDVVVILNQEKRRKRGRVGAGAPPKKSKKSRDVVEIKPDTSFEAFKQAVVAAVIGLAHPYELESAFCYTDLDLAAKIPNAQDPMWRTSFPIKTDERFKDFKLNVFKTNARYAETHLEVNEVATSDDDDFADDSYDEEDTPTQPGKRKRKSGTTAAAASAKLAKEVELEAERIDTMKELNKRWKCEKDGCSGNGKQCYVHPNGEHTTLTMEHKRNWVRSIVDFKVGTIEKAPGSLFDSPVKPRGLNGSRSSSSFTPRSKGKSKAKDSAFTIILSSGANTPSH
ncbi:hypothetical protein OC844_007057, partial [Tilletia horrida]